MPRRGSSGLSSDGGRCRLLPGLADLDTPIYKYGVTDDKADWNETGVDFFPQLTLRHLISQATGYGAPPPRKRSRIDRIEPRSFERFLQLNAANLWLKIHCCL